MKPRSYFRRTLPAVAGVLFGVVGLGGMAAGAGAQDASDVKLLVHLDPMYQPPTSLNCSGNSTVNATGALDTDYFAFVVAANVDTSQGLLSASFGIYYHPGDLSGLNIADWQSLAQGTVAEPDWPDPGTGIDLSFFSCQGTVADPADAQGRGVVVLGYFAVSATSPDYLMIVPRFADDDAPMTVIDCSLVTRWVDPSQSGSAGFQYAGDDPCQGPIDRFPYACCLETGCETLNPLYCEYLGGVLPTVPLTTCAEFNCTVPAIPTTWGRIKAIYR